MYTKKIICKFNIEYSSKWMLEKIYSGLYVDLTPILFKFDDKYLITVNITNDNTSLNIIVIGSTKVVTDRLTEKSNWFVRGGYICNLAIRSHEKDREGNIILGSGISVTAIEGTIKRVIVKCAKEEQIFNLTQELFEPTAQDYKLYQEVHEKRKEEYEKQDKQEKKTL